MVYAIIIGSAIAIVLIMTDGLKDLTSNRTKNDRFSRFNDKSFDDKGIHYIKEKAINRERVSRLDAEKQDLYAAAQCIYILFNRGRMAPNKGDIPTPTDSPSYEFTALLRSALNPDISEVPDCAVIKRKLKSIMKGENTSESNTCGKGITQKQTYSSGKCTDSSNSHNKQRRISGRNSSDRPFYPKGHF